MMGGMNIIVGVLVCTLVGVANGTEPRPVDVGPAVDRPGVESAAAPSELEEIALHSVVIREDHPGFGRQLGEEEKPTI